jgi:hypothetical protein
LKPGVKTYAAKTVAFDNGSRVIASATSKNSFRGWTINGILLADISKKSFGVQITQLYLLQKNLN